MNDRTPEVQTKEKHAVPIAIDDKACSLGNRPRTSLELQKNVRSDHQNLTEANPEGDLLKGRRSVRKEKEEEVHKNAKVVVGYALTSKKVKSFLKPKLEVLARYAC